MASATVTFNGITFHRYPTSKRWADRMYFTPGVSARKSGVKRLHEEIWMAVSGEQIPPGWHIHHIDTNTLNNDPGNLVCIPASEHRTWHAEQPRTATQIAAWETYRAKASDWHRSDVGRAWHAEHGRTAWTGRPYRTLICQQCGAPFDTRDARDTPKFCSNACKAKARRDTGADDMQRTCAVCGESFTTNRYHKTETCSRSCAGKLARQRRTVT